MARDDTFSERMCLLLGLGCLVVALAAAWSGLAVPLREALSVRDWVEVPARVIETDLERSWAGKGGRTLVLEATARYRYRVAGTEHVGTRVGLVAGADNIGDYQTRMFERLRRARDDRVPLTAYVDPSDPSRAVLDPRIRWKAILFNVIFSLLFGAAGVWAIGDGRCRRRREAAVEIAGGEAPPSDPLRIVASSRSIRELGSFALLWVGFVLVLVLIGASDPDKIIKPVSYVALVGALGTVGTCMLGVAAWRWWNWRTYGPGEIRLDASPGLDAERLSGTLALRPERPDGCELDATLSLESYDRRASDQRKKEVLWASRTRVAFRGPPGDVRGRFDVPLAAARVGDHEIAPPVVLNWVLTVRVDEPRLEREFVVPIDGRTRSERPVTPDKAPPERTPTGATNEELATKLRRRG